MKALFTTVTVSFSSYVILGGLKNSLYSITPFALSYVIISAFAHISSFHADILPRKVVLNYAVYLSATIFSTFFIAAFLRIEMTLTTLLLSALLFLTLERLMASFAKYAVSRSFDSQYILKPYRERVDKALIEIKNVKDSVDKVHWIDSLEEMKLRFWFVVLESDLSQPLTLFDRELKSIEKWIERHSL